MKMLSLDFIKTVFKTVFYYSASIATLITNYHQKSICTTKPTLKK